MRLRDKRDEGRGSRVAGRGAAALTRARWREAVERVARGVALAALLALLVDAWRARPVADARRADAGALDSALVRWSTSESPVAVHVRVGSDLSPVQRDWIAAIRAAGTAVSWESAGAIPLAAVADPVSDPAGGTSVLVAAPRGSTAELADQYGVLDSVRSAGAGGRFVARSAPGAVRVQAGALSARAVTRDSLVLGRVLVLGDVGWEAKFVAAALEERGWRVDVRMELGPKGSVVQLSSELRGQSSEGRGSRVSAFVLDTARYSVVIALDSSAVGYAAGITAYVRSGGGLIATPAALALPALSALGVGMPGSVRDPVEPFEPDTVQPRRSLALRPIAVRSDAVPLERRGADVAIAARRVERGRVAVVGYADTWRWRMGGGADAVDRHRDWWADLVARVAHTSRIEQAVLTPIDEAPYARLVESLGPPVGAGGLPGARRFPVALLAALLGLALLSEWASRRLRGVP